MTLYRSIRRVLELPPRVAWRKVRNKTHERLKSSVGRLRAQLLGTDLSDDAFLSALDNRFSTMQTFLDQISIKDGAFFFLNPDLRQVIINAIRDCCPQVEVSTITAANQVCDHIFELLGSGPTQLGEQINWHVDFKTSHRFDSNRYYAFIRPAPYPGGYDIKVPWELSRCQHFAWLGQAYWFSGDEKYPQEFVSQVMDWIKHNPPQFGVNWACTMDVAIRAVNWLWGYCFFKDSPSLNDDFLLEFFKSLFIHGQHIFHNLENQGNFTGNHYLTNLVGLVYLGIMCPEFKEAQHWREFGLQELEKEMFKQVYSDGVNFEASTSYHCLVTEMFLSAAVLAQLNGHEFSQPFMARLEKMVVFVMYLTKPDGTVSLIGDNDNGRLHRLKIWKTPAQEWVDHRYLLAIGAVLFKREDFAQAAGDQWEEAIWMLGEKALSYKQKVDFKALPPLQLESRAFPDAGYYIMRHNDAYVIVNAGAVGQNGIGGHSHNDLLGFEFFYNGVNWITDSGTYTYTGDYEKRNYFRSTRAHNVIMVDGMEINPINKKSAFGIDNFGKPILVSWKSNEEYDLILSEHNGFQHLGKGLITRRAIIFFKKERTLLVKDMFHNNKPHRFENLIHFSPGCYIEKKDENFIINDPMGNDVLFLIAEPVCNNSKIETVQFSTSYGSKVDGLCLNLVYSTSNINCHYFLSENYISLENRIKLLTKSNQYMKN